MAELKGCLTIKRVCLSADSKKGTISLLYNIHILKRHCHEIVDTFLFGSFIVQPKLYRKVFFFAKIYLVYSFTVYTVSVRKQRGRNACITLPFNLTNHNKVVFCKKIRKTHISESKFLVCTILYNVKHKAENLNKKFWNKCNEGSIT